MATFEARMKRAVLAIQGVKIPELPEEVMQLDQELNSKFANASKVAEIIEKNTTISGTVMQLAQSPMAKAKQPVTSIRGAVDILGMQNLYNFVVTAALCNMFKSSRTIKDIMDNSVDVAFCMADLAEWVDGVSRDEAYMLGLFHNVGALMLATKDAENYKEMYTSYLSKPLSSVVKENELFGCHHGLVGALVARKWKLNADMIQAIMFHHNQNTDNLKGDKPRAMIAMLKISNMIITEISLGSYQGRESEDYMQSGLEELLLPSEAITELRTAILSYSFKD